MRRKSTDRTLAPIRVEYFIFFFSNDSKNDDSREPLVSDVRHPCILLNPENSGIYRKFSFRLEENQEMSLHKNLFKRKNFINRHFL